MTRIARNTFAAAAGIVLVVAGAPAAVAEPAMTAVQIEGGCAGPVCGTIRNDTDTHVLVCKGWRGPGDDETYPTAGTCPKNQWAYVKPHSTYGAPQLVDIDAFYIASGTSYTGYYVHFPSTTHHNRTWRHVHQGWWKFATNVTVYIKSKRG